MNYSMCEEDNTCVQSVTTCSEELTEGNTSIISNIFQGDGADTISEISFSPSEEEDRIMDDDNDNQGEDGMSSLNDYSMMMLEDSDDGDEE